MPLINPDDSLSLCAVMFGLTAMGFWLDGTAFGRRTSGALWIIVGGLFLSNLGVVPFEAPVYDFTFSHLVPMAIPLLLLRADLRRIIRESGRVMVAFLIASFAVVVGAIVGFHLIPMGPIGAKVAGVYTGGWIGGTVSFVAVSQAVHMTPAEFTLAMGASSPVSIAALLLLITLPSLAILRRFIPTKFDVNEVDSTDLVIEAQPKSYRAAELAGLITLGFAISSIGSLFADAMGWHDYRIVVISVLSLIVANLVPGRIRRLTLDFDVGMFVMYMFFACVGMITNANIFNGEALLLVLYATLMLAIHFVVLLGAAKLLRIDLADAVIGSAAAVMGPAPTAAIASARGWNELVTPGIMCAIFGKAIATFIGLGVAMLLR